MIVFLVRPSLVALSSLLLSLSLSPCRSHSVFIFCLAILLAFCLLFSAMRQLLSDIEKLGLRLSHQGTQTGCGCHTRAPKPISVSCVCRGAEARTCRTWKTKRAANLAKPTNRTRCAESEMNRTTYPLEARGTKKSYLTNLSSLHLQPACPTS